VVLSCTVVKHLNPKPQKHTSLSCPAVKHLHPNPQKKHQFILSSNQTSQTTNCYKVNLFQFVMLSSISSQILLQSESLPICHAVKHLKPQPATKRIPSNLSRCQASPPKPTKKHQFILSSNQTSQTTTCYKVNLFQFVMLSSISSQILLQSESLPICHAVKHLQPNPSRK
jgi:hypothetical protein